MHTVGRSSLMTSPKHSLDDAGVSEMNGCVLAHEDCGIHCGFRNANPCTSPGRTQGHSSLCQMEVGGSEHDTVWSLWSPPSQ